MLHLVLLRQIEVIHLILIYHVVERRHIQLIESHDGLLKLVRDEWIERLLATSLMLQIV